MPEGRLIIGNQRYSSWSMRGWLAVRLAELDVAIEVIPMQAGITSAIRDATPAGLVPYLEHRGVRVWESLAICEYCAEQRQGLWPEATGERARARSVAAEMHAGFRPLRLAMPMNCGRQAIKLAAGIAPEVASDIARIEAIWSEARGSFLFGDVFGMVDAMYAPVVSRLLSYDVPLGHRASAYRDAVRNHPLLIEWYEQAAAEPIAWQLAKHEGVA